MTADTVTRLRWGVIGIGDFLTGTIAPAMAAEPACRLFAAVSRDQERVSDFGRAFGVDHTYTDYDEMLANPDVDAVYIATPNSMHAAQVIAAARAGKHVFCEKPMANNVPDAVAAVAACDRAGVRLGIDFHNRYLPWIQDASRIVAAGTIGSVRIVELDVGSGPRRYDNWRADPGIAGLGSVHNVGVHAFDFLRAILGSEPVEVSAMFDVEPGTGSVEMLAMLLMRFDDGALVYCNCNETVPHPRNEITIYGTKGRIVGTRFTRSRFDGDLTVTVGHEETVTHYPAPQAHRGCLAAFTQAVLESREPDPSGLDGLRSVQLCDAIARSARERRSVGVDYSAGGHSLAGPS